MRKTVFYGIYLTLAMGGFASQYVPVELDEGLDRGGVWNSLISKNLAHYSLSLKFLLIL